MEKATIKAFGTVLKQQFRPPEDLPFPLQNALQALADLPDDKAVPAETRQKPPLATNGH
jgi:hypothetical protein